MDPRLGIAHAHLSCTLIHHVVTLLAHCMISPRASQLPYSCAATHRIQQTLGDDPHVHQVQRANPASERPEKAHQTRWRQPARLQGCAAGRGDPENPGNQQRLQGLQQNGDLFLMRAVAIFVGHQKNRKL